MLGAGCRGGNGAMVVASALQWPEWCCGWWRASDFGGVRLVLLQGTGRLEPPGLGKAQAALNSLKQVEAAGWEEPVPGPSRPPATAPQMPPCAGAQQQLSAVHGTRIRRHAFTRPAERSRVRASITARGRMLGTEYSQRRIRCRAMVSCIIRCWMGDAAIGVMPSARDYYCTADGRCLSAIQYCASCQTSLLRGPTTPEPQEQIFCPGANHDLLHVDNGRVNYALSVPRYCKYL
ncbi:hypothetical protein F5884DRAFT_889256 [Xylogone sp. PMI_703]|nr:hypothetical protein F5884DRAFT_889256 [Xylogone sp. PMI_703]